MNIENIEKKKSEALTRILLNGSRNLDRMKQETMDIVNILISMMMSSAKKMPPQDYIKEPKPKWIAFDSVQNCIVGSWVIFKPRTSSRMMEVTAGDISTGDFAIAYLDAVETHDSFPRFFIGSPGTVSAKMTHVQLIHSCLPSLVSGIEERFQFLGDEYGKAVLKADGHTHSYSCL